MAEVKLADVERPIDYVFTLVKRAAGICETLQTSPKPSIQAIYSKYERQIDAAHRDLNVMSNSLQAAVSEAGTKDVNHNAIEEKLARTVIRSVNASQRAIDLFDQLCDEYDLPRTEVSLFSRIGSLLHQ